MSMVKSRRAGEISYYDDKKPKVWIDDRPRPLPDLDLSSITEVRHKKWVYHRPPPRTFRRFVSHPLTILFAALGIGALVYALISF